MAGDNWPLISYGDLLKKVNACINLNSFPWVIDRTTSPSPHHHRQQAVCKGWVGEKHGVIAVITHADVTHCFDGMGGFYEDKLTFNYEHKHSDKKSLVWAAPVERQTKPGGKLVDSSCEMSLSRLAIQSLSPREFPLRGVSLWLSFTVLLSLKTPGALSSRKPPKIPAVYTWDLAPWTAMSLGKWYGILKCPWRSSMRTKGWFWCSCPLAYTILIYIHHLSGKTVSYMYCTSLQSCPLNK